MIEHLALVWRGDVPMAEALRSRSVHTHGNVHLARTIQNWLGICLYADVAAQESPLTPGDNE
jgi:hypothetical protein